MSETLIRGAYVLTMDEELGNLPVGDVLIRDETIAAVGMDIEAPVAEVLDGTGRIVMPGLVDGHRHMFSGLLRGGCSDVSYTGNQGGYFEVVIRQFGGNFTPHDSYTASRVGALESLNGGITTLHAWDHNIISYEHAAGSFEAMCETGLRGRYSYGPPNDTMVVDQDGVSRLKQERFTREDGGRHTTSDGLWHLGLATRGVELDRPELWQDEIAFARREGLPYTAHLMHAGHVAELDEQGMLGPDLLACHCLGVTEDEMRILQRTATPVCISTPALARTGQMPSPLIPLKDAGVHLCLSVDSTAGCDTADMFAVMRITLIVERMLHESAGVYSSHEVIRHATIDAASALGLGSVTGSLTPGKRADVIVLDTSNALNAAPFTLAEPLIATCMYPSNVETVFVDGHCLKRDGKLVGVDVAAVVAEANETFKALEQRVGQPFA